jgi:SAM-dependent methyltransferase
MEGYDAATYGDRFADVYDAWYPRSEESATAAGALGRLADGGAVLELGCGTGRLLLPLHEAGLCVVGLDASERMLDLLAAKAGPDGPEAVLGDMADFTIAGAEGPRRFALVFAAFNTLFNLATAEALDGCFASVARHLEPEGRFAVECFVPGWAEGPRDAVEVRDLTADRVVLRVSRHDPDRQTVSGQHVELSESGARLRPWHLRYALPHQLDAHAARAGLSLVARWADWERSPFGPDSTQHVSVYRRGGAPEPGPPPRR